MAMLQVSPESISLTGVHDMSIINPANGRAIFSTSDPEMELPAGLSLLETAQAEVAQVSSPVDQPLLVR